ncbi:MAG: outer membrane protein OmpA-like peptidoglycan-associated protein [Patiriisocius sp.]|jgi:outer membrane protein OmpA-like peptidoglycan-associated protein
MAQDDCKGSEDKKVQKLIDKVRTGKMELGAKIAAMRDAIDMEEDCVECHYQLGLRLYRKSKANGSSYLEAIEEMMFVKNQCPTYNSDVYFYLGLMNYGMESWAASQEAFLEHQNLQEGSELSRDYDRKKNDVSDVLLELQFKIAMNSGDIEITKSKVLGVSSSVDEYLPTLSLDNELMFYTRKFEKKAKGDFVSKMVEEFSMSSRLGVNDEFDKGSSLPSPFNLGDNYGGATISIDNKEMYITICKPVKGGYNNCDIYFSRIEKYTNPKNGKQEQRWSEFKNLGPSVNTVDGWESQPSLNAEGDILYFATARATTIKNKSGVPGMDIYYSTKKGDGTWGEAESLGNDINSNGNEKSPFMHGDSKTLYFSSDSYAGIGKYDIYFSRLSEDGTWSKPVNLGSPINTEDDEHGMIVSTDGKQAYYASNKLEGAQGYDIFTFPMPEVARPDKVVLLKGELKDENGKAVTDAKIELKYINSKKVEKIEVNEEGGYAKIINVEKEPVVMKVEKEGFAFQARVFSEELLDETPVVKSEIKIEKVVVGKPYRINDINYTTNSAEISKDSKLILNEFAEYLAKKKNLKITIQGHTDDVGDATSNQKLSTQRAAQVMAYLIERKVAPGRMNFQGFGPSNPIVKNDSEVNRAKNRRTEFVIESE